MLHIFKRSDRTMQCYCEDQAIVCTTCGRGCREAVQLESSTLGANIST